MFSLHFSTREKEICLQLATDYTILAYWIFPWYTSKMFFPTWVFFAYDSWKACVDTRPQLFHFSVLELASNWQEQNWEPSGWGILCNNIRCCFTVMVSSIKHDIQMKVCTAGEKKKLSGKSESGHGKRVETQW